MGVPGIIGAIALFFAFTGQHMAGMASYIEFILLGIGLIFLLMEVFVIPGFGVAGVTGILCVAAAAVLALQDFTIPSPDIPFQSVILQMNIQRIGISFFGSIVIIVIFFWQIFPRLSYLENGPILTTNLNSSGTAEQKEVNPLVGLIGVASKDLHPSGKVLIETKVYDAISEGMLIEKGESIVVVGEKPGSLVVRKEHV